MVASVGSFKKRRFQSALLDSFCLDWLFIVFLMLELDMLGSFCLMFVLVRRLSLAGLILELLTPWILELVPLILEFDGVGWLTSDCGLTYMLIAFEYINSWSLYLWADTPMLEAPRLLLLGSPNLEFFISLCSLGGIMILITSSSGLRIVYLRWSPYFGFTASRRVSCMKPAFFYPSFSSIILFFSWVRRSIHRYNNFLV